MGFNISIVVSDRGCLIHHFPWECFFCIHFHFLVSFSNQILLLSNPSFGPRLSIDLFYFVMFRGCKLLLRTHFLYHAVAANRIIFI